MFLIDQALTVRVLTHVVIGAVVGVLVVHTAQFIRRRVRSWILRRRVRRILEREGLWRSRS